MKYLSMFSGIEAATVAWHPLGWKPLAFCEVDPFPSAVLAHHYPDVPNLGDVTKADFDAIERPNLIVFGSPCQSFSVAGKRLGLDDPRGNLALYALSVVNRLRPRWFLFENVPGLLSSGGGRDFGAFLGTVGECGYSCSWRILDAQYFGVPQRRRRVFVVGHLGDWRRAAAVLFERHSLQGHPPPRREAGERVADSLTVGANQCLGRPGDFVEDIAHSLRGEGFDASEDGTGRGTPLVPVAFRHNASFAEHGVDVCGTLNAMNGHAIAFGWQNSPSQGDSVSEHVTPSLDKSKTPAVCWQQTMPTLCREPGGQASQDWQQHAAVISGAAVRRLLPTECEALQGFPRDYTLVPYRGKPASDGPRYKALGNSMAVPVMRWIGERIAMVERIPASARVAA